MPVHQLLFPLQSALHKYTRKTILRARREGTQRHTDGTKVYHAQKQQLHTGVLCVLVRQVKHSNVTTLEE